MNSFFPEYLNQGSQGPAVRLLQMLLKFAGQNPDLEVDGIYGPTTAQGIRSLQVSMLMEFDDVDGNFGPKTRATLLRVRGLDINAIPADAFVGETHAVRPD